MLNDGRRFGSTVPINPIGGGVDDSEWTESVQGKGGVSREKVRTCEVRSADLLGEKLLGALVADLADDARTRLLRVEVVHLEHSDDRLRVRFDVGHARVREHNDALRVLRQLLDREQRSLQRCVAWRILHRQVLQLRDLCIGTVRVRGK